MTKRRYTLNDLDVADSAQFTREGDIVIHDHIVRFARPLSLAERRLFVDVLVGFYHTVHFSRQFGRGLVAEPVVQFTDDTSARYTLRQTSLDGPWKDLLFTILANFSREVVPILRHDDTLVFAPETVPG
jgi:hypothetical protein